MRSVISCIVLAVWLVATGAAHAQAGKPLTNQDVIDMVAAGLPESTVLLSIKQSPASFSTSPQDLIALKKAGVSPRIMDAMMTAASGSGAASAPVTGGESALIPTAYGQYAIAAGKLQSLPATSVDLVFGITLVDGGVAADGFKANREAVLIDDLNPQFIFYAHQLDPRQVKLTRLKLVETMTAWQFNRGSDPGPFQAIYGVSPSKVIDVNLLRAAEPVGLAIEPVVGRAGMYRFTPQRPLERGEQYALYTGDALHDIKYLVTAKLNRAPLYAVFFRTPGVPATSAVASSDAAAPTQSAGYRNCRSLGTPPESCALLYPPTAAADVSAKPAVSAADAGPVLGIWVGSLSGWLPYEAAIEIRVGVNGEVSGISEYSASVPSEPLQCRAGLKLTDTASGHFTFDEQVTDNLGKCPSAGIVRMTINADGSADVKLFRRDNLEKASYKGTMRKAR